MNLFPYSYGGKVRKPSAAERAAERYKEKVRDAAWALRPLLCELALEPGGFAKVPALFAAIEIPRGYKDNAIGFRFSVFQDMDERPGYYNYFGSWHSVLRQCRNHPVHGPELFDAFNARGEFAPVKKPKSKAA
jgi:hypothetical protein